jgi:serine O-acetyltransferase
LAGRYSENNGDMMLKMKDYIMTEIGNNKKRSRLTIIKRIIFYPAYNAVFLIRVYQKLQSQKLCKFLSFWVYRMLVRRYGIYIGKNTEIGIGLKMPHPNGIVIGEGVRLGKNNIVYQQVTFGGKNYGDAQKMKYPQTGDCCIFFAGAKIIGDIKVADHTTVGANAVLFCDTERDSIYAGVPAKRIK